MIAALAAIGAGRIGITSPPGLAALESSGDAFVESFGFGVLPGVRPATVETSEGMTAVTLEADVGSAVARLDAESGRLMGLALTIGADHVDSPEAPRE